MFLTVETLTGTLGGWKPRVVVVSAATRCRIFAESAFAVTLKAEVSDLLKLPVVSAAMKNVEVKGVME